MCVCACLTLVLGRCLRGCMCARAWQHTWSFAVRHSPWRVLTPRPVLPPPLSVSASFLYPYTDLIPSSLLFYPPILSCSPVSFVSAAVTTIQGGDAGQAARSFWQDMALGIGRLDGPGNSLLISYFFDVLLFFLLSPCPHVAWCIARLPVFINLLYLLQGYFTKTHETLYTDLVSNCC